MKLSISHECRVGSDRDLGSQNPDRDPIFGSGSGFAIFFEKWDRDRDFAQVIASIPAILES
jgi:hypothetical protein